MMWGFIAGFMIGGSFGFIICAMISGPAIAEAKSRANAMEARLKLNEAQMEQN